MRTARAAALPLAALLWLVILVVAPLAARSPAAAHGAAAVYRSASLICHQKPERSFRVAGIQMPVCGRCLGLYVAGAAGALAAFVVGRRSFPEPRIRGFMLTAAALPMACSVGFEVTGLAEGSNIVRLASALPLGAVAGWLLEQVLLDEYRPVFATPGNRPAI